MTELEYLHPTTPAAPGPIASAVLRRWPWKAWVALALFGLGPCLLFLGWPLTPTSLYAWPGFGVFAGTFSMLPLCVVAAARSMARAALAKRYRVTPVPDERRVCTVLAAMAVYWLVVGTPIGVKVGVALRWSAFESLRTRMANGWPPQGASAMLPFRVTDAEQYENGVIIVYTEGSRGDFPGNGVGFLYLPDGVEFPGYNTGSDGHAVGRWHWFVTD